MLNDGTAVDSGINESEGGEVEYQSTETPWVADTQVKKWIPKVLAERNALAKEVEDLRLQLEAKAAQTVDEKFAERDRLTERKSFTEEYGETALKDVDAVLQKYPDLNYADAYAIANKPQKGYAMQGSVPQSVTDPDSKPLTIDQLEAKLKQEIAEGKVRI